ncbi:MAG: hypothetical protein M3448_06220 [Pseudomonadota bacterium]|nr:hypothetical protein [Pseudomonadota bacterium]
MEQIAALRAEWLARLSEAIDGAQRVAWQLRTSESVSQEARELYSRLETARVELESLRVLPEKDFGPDDSDWLGKLGWSSTLLDMPD